MSENYRFYTEKLAEARAKRRTDGPLREQLDELFGLVRWCERIWAIEDRIDRDIDRDVRRGSRL
jgi:hypothetical protein